MLYEISIMDNNIIFIGFLDYIINTRSLINTCTVHASTAAIINTAQYDDLYFDTIIF